MRSLCPTLDGDSRSTSAKSPEGQDKPTKVKRQPVTAKCNSFFSKFNHQSKSSIEQCDMYLVIYFGEFTADSKE